jgi:hypothetical protein
MPNRLQIADGPPDQLVRLNVRIPRWLKRDVAGAAGDIGKNLNDWVRDALREALDRARSKAGGVSARGRARGRVPARR